MTGRAQDVPDDPPMMSGNAALVPDLLPLTPTLSQRERGLKAGGLNAYTVNICQSDELTVK